MDYKLNEFQTSLEEIKENVSSSVFADLIEYIETVDFIKWLISDESVRGTIADRPYMVDDNETVLTRKEIDITKPHMLEDMDYFRKRAIYFEKHGVYTHITPNRNPKSEYARFWEEELRRCKYGHERRDGEWIPGPLYFYWNYTKIAVSEKVEGTKGRAKRVKKFPRVYLGDYLFFHYIEQARNEGQHGKMLKSRGIGASFKFSALSVCYMYTNKGSENPNFHLASDKGFLLGDKGIWGKVLDNMDYIADHTPWPKVRIVNKISAMEQQLGYEDQYGRRRGLLSSVHGVSLKDNPDKARGIRTGSLIHYEEDGLFPHLEKAWNVNREGTEEDGRAFAIMFAAGTGGVEGASFEGSEKLFYFPSAYNIYAIPNVFDKNTHGTTQCGFFWGAYMNKGESVTKANGEPDVTASLVRILEERELISRNSADSAALTQKKAELPVTPQEAVMRTEGTVFPVADLKDYLANIKPNEVEFRSSHYIGRLAMGPNGTVEWKVDADVSPLRSFSNPGLIKTGGVEIFVPPSNSKPYLRYIAGIDPYDDDTGTSLGSIFVYDTFTDNIVAEYTGRPEFANDFYEICRRLLVYYGATALYENKNKGLYNYFYQNGAINLLADNPQILKDLDLSAKKENYGNKLKGFNPTKEVNAWGRRLQADWLKTKWEENEEENTVIKNMHRVRSIPYIEECIAWHADGNFDRVSAMGALMIYREEIKRFIDEGEEKPVNSFIANKEWDKVMGLNNRY